MTLPEAIKVLEEYYSFRQGNSGGKLTGELVNEALEIAINTLKQGK